MTNGSENIKIIFCDIDNTIIPAGVESISSRLKEDFQKAAQKGIKIVIDTGRHYTFMQESLFQDIPMEEIITINGASINKRNGETIHKYPMSKELMEKIITFCDAQEVGLGFKFEDRIVTYANFEKFAEGYVGEDMRLRAMLVNDDATRSHHLTAGYPLGTFLIGDKETISTFIEKIPECTFAWSFRRGFDVFSKSINKATAAQVILDQYGLSWENAIGFGDAGNDSPFIEKCQIGVAMGNAKDDVKEHASIVAPPCDEDGVAQVLEELHIV